MADPQTDAASNTADSGGVVVEAKQGPGSSHNNNGHSTIQSLRVAKPFPPRQGSPPSATQSPVGQNPVDSPDLTPRSAWSARLNPQVKTRRKDDKNLGLGSPGRVLIRLAARARANAALKSPRLSSPTRRGSGKIRRRSLGPAFDSLEHSYADFSQDSIFNSPTVQSRRNSIGLYEQSPAASPSARRPSAEARAAVHRDRQRQSQKRIEINSKVEARLRGVKTYLASMFVVCSLDPTQYRWFGDSYAAWGLSLDSENKKLYRPRIDSQINPRSFDAEKILDGIFPVGLRPSFLTEELGVSSPHREQHQSTTGTQSDGVDTRPPHMRPSSHAFVVTNESGKKTYVSCLTWRERFENPTLEFILNDDLVCTRFESHLDVAGADDDRLRHDFEVVKLIHRLVSSSVVKPRGGAGTDTDSNGETSQDASTNTAVLEQVEEYAKRQSLRFHRDHPERLMQEVVQKSKLRAYIDSFEMYAPRAMALASDSPYFNTFSDFLHEVHRMVFTGQSPRVPIERILQFFMTDVPRPPRGYVSIQFRLSEEQEVTSQLFSLESSARNAMPKIYFDMRPTFKALTPASVVRIFGCLLLEMRVIICGSNLGLVFEACETFRQLLFPFNWQHPYIPIFAYPWMPLLRAPVPYFIGMPADLMHPELRASLLGSGVVIADLDLATLSGVNTAYQHVAENCGLLQSHMSNRVASQHQVTVLPAYYYNRLYTQLEQICSEMKVAEAMSKEVSKDRGYSSAAVDENVAETIAAAAGFETGVRHAFMNVLAQYMQGYDTFVDWERATGLPSDADDGNTTTASNSTIFDAAGFIKSREHRYASSEVFFRSFPDTSLFTEFLHKRLWQYEPSAEQMFFDYSIDKTTEESRAFFDDSSHRGINFGGSDSRRPSDAEPSSARGSGSQTPSYRSLVQAASDRSLLNNKRPIYIAPPTAIHGSENVVIDGVRHVIKPPFHGAPVTKFPVLKMEYLIGISDADQEAAAAIVAAEDVEEVSCDDSFSSSDDESTDRTSQIRRKRATAELGTAERPKRIKSFSQAIDDRSRLAAAQAKAAAKADPLAAYVWFSIFGSGSKKDKAIVLDLQKRALQSTAGAGDPGGCDMSDATEDVRGFTVFDPIRLGNLDSFHRGTKSRSAMEDEDLNIIVHFSTRIMNERFNCSMLNTRSIRKQILAAINIAARFRDMLGLFSKLVERRNNVFAKTVNSFSYSKVAKESSRYLRCTDGPAREETISPSAADTAAGNGDSSSSPRTFSSSLRGLSTQSNDAAVDPDAALSDYVWPNLCGVLPSLLGNIRQMADKINVMVCTPLNDLLRRFDNTRQTRATYKDQLIEDLLSKRKATERAQKEYFDAYYRAQEAHHEFDAAAMVQQHGLDGDNSMRERRIERLAAAELHNTKCQAKAFSAELTFTTTVLALQNSLRAFMNRSDALISSIREDDTSSVKSILALLGTLVDITGHANGTTSSEGVWWDATQRQKLAAQHLVPHRQEIAFLVPPTLESGPKISLQFASGLVVEQALPDGAKPGDRFSASIPITTMATQDFNNEDERHRQYLDHTKRVHKATASVAHMLKTMLATIDSMVKSSPDLSVALQIHQTLVDSESEASDAVLPDSSGTMHGSPRDRSQTLPALNVTPTKRGSVNKLPSLIKQRSLSAIKSIKTRLNSTFSSPFLNSPSGKYGSWYSEKMASPATFRQFTWKKHLGGEHNGANSSERAVLEPSSPGPGGLPYVGGFQVEDDKTSGSIASSRQRIGPDTPQGSSLLEVTPIEVSDAAPNLRLGQGSLRLAGDVDDAMLHNIQVNAKHESEPLQVSPTKLDFPSPSSPGTTLAETAEAIKQVENMTAAFFMMLRTHFQETARCFVLLDDMATLSKSITSDAQEQLTTAAKEVDKSVRAKIESEKELQNLRNLLEKSGRGFESCSERLAAAKVKMPDVRYEWPNPSALASDIKFRTKTDIHNLFKKKDDCANAFIGAVHGSRKKAIEDSGLRKDYMLRMVNNESVVGKSFNTIMQILGLSKNANAKVTVDGNTALVLDFGCEEYAHEQEAATKHAEAANAVEAGRVRDTRREMELNQFRQNFQRLRRDTMAQLEKHATVRLTGLLEHLPSMESTIASAIKVASSAVASARTSLEGVDVERDLQLTADLKRLTEPFNVAPLPFTSTPSRTPVDGHDGGKSSLPTQETPANGMEAIPPSDQIDDDSSETSRQNYAHLSDGFSRAGRAVQAVSSLRTFFERLALGKLNGRQQLHAAATAFSASELGKEAFGTPTDQDHCGLDDYVFRLCQEEVSSHGNELPENIAATRLACVESSVLGAIGSLRRSFLPKSEIAALTFLYGGKTPAHKSGDVGGSTLGATQEHAGAAVDTADISSSVKLFDVFVTRPQRRLNEAREAFQQANEELIAAQRGYNDSTLFVATSKKKLAAAHSNFERAELLCGERETAFQQSQNIWRDAVQILEVQLNHLVARTIDAVGVITEDYIRQEADTARSHRDKAQDRLQTLEQMSLSPNPSVDKKAVEEVSGQIAPSGNVDGGTDGVGGLSLYQPLRICNLMHHFAMGQTSQFVSHFDTCLDPSNKGDIFAPAPKSGSLVLAESLASCLRALPFLDRADDDTGDITADASRPSLIGVQRRARARTTSSGGHSTDRRQSNSRGSSRGRSCGLTTVRGEAYGDRSRAVRALRALWDYVLARRDLVSLAFSRSDDLRLLGIVPPPKHESLLGEHPTLSNARRRRTELRSVLGPKTKDTLRRIFDECPPAQHLLSYVRTTSSLPRTSTSSRRQFDSLGHGPDDMRRMGLLYAHLRVRVLQARHAPLLDLMALPEFHVGFGEFLRRKGDETSSRTLRAFLCFLELSQILATAGLFSLSTDGAMAFHLGGQGTHIHSENGVGQEHPNEHNDSVGIFELPLPPGVATGICHQPLAHCYGHTLFVGTEDDAASTATNSNAKQPPALTSISAQRMSVERSVMLLHRKYFSSEATETKTSVNLGQRGRSFAAALEQAVTAHDTGEVVTLCWRLLELLLETLQGAFKAFQESSEGKDVLKAAAPAQDDKEDSESPSGFSSPEASTVAPKTSNDNATATILMAELAHVTKATTNRGHNLRSSGADRILSSVAPQLLRQTGQFGWWGLLWADLWRLFANDNRIREEFIFKCADSISNLSVPGKKEALDDAERVHRCLHVQWLFILNLVVRHLTKLNAALKGAVATAAQEALDSIHPSD